MFARSLFVMGVAIVLAACGKPADIKSNCSTNGFGKIDCTFTNKGEGDGDVCEFVALTRMGVPDNYLVAKGKTVIISTEVCSGIVKSRDVVQRTFSGGFEVPPSEFCSYKVDGESVYGKSWADSCILYTFDAKSKTDPRCYQIDALRNNSVSGSELVKISSLTSASTILMEISSENIKCP